MLKYEEGVSDGTTLAVVVRNYFLQAKCNFFFVCLRDMSIILLKCRQSQYELYRLNTL